VVTVTVIVALTVLAFTHMQAAPSMAAAIRAGVSAGRVSTVIRQDVLVR